MRARKTGAPQGTAPRSSTITRTAAALAALVTASALVAGCSSSKSSTAASAPAMGVKAPDAAAAAGGTGGGGAAAAKPAAPNATASAPANAPGQASNPVSNIAAADRSLIYTAGLTVRVKDVLSATANAEQLATAAGGFVGDEKTQSGGPDGDVGIVEAVISLRVPNEKFDSVLNSLGTGGAIESQTRSASDVTDQVVDTTSRITSAETAIARLNDLIKTATGLDQIVALEGDLATREADLDSLKSRLAALQDQTALSTITVTYHTPQAAPPPPPAPPKKRNAFVRGLASGWHAFENVARVLFIAAGGLLPFAAVIAILWWPARRLYRIRLRALARISEDRDRALAAARAEADARDAARDAARAEAKAKTQTPA